MIPIDFQSMWFKIKVKLLAFVFHGISFDSSVKVLPNMIQKLSIDNRLHVPLLIFRVQGHCQNSNICLMYCHLMPSDPISEQLLNCVKSLS